MERVKEQLKLSLENKNGVVQTGELTVVLDGLAIEPENLTSCSSAPTSKLLCVCKIQGNVGRRYKTNFSLSRCSVEIQQNGDALRENGEPSARTSR